MVVGEFLASINGKIYRPREPVTNIIAVDISYHFSRS